MTKTSLPNSNSTNKICSIVGCETKTFLKGWCSKHYYRWRRHGNPEILLTRMGEGDTFEERFWSRVDKTPNPKGCWVWKGNTYKKGYGTTKYKGRQYGTHILSWFLAHGKMPEKHVLHYCDNPPCVNPEHLHEGTNAENVQEKIERNRQAKGEKIHTCKLNESQVKEIKILLATTNLKQKEVGDMFGVHYVTIGQIKAGKTWKYVAANPDLINTELSANKGVK